ncbi:hypothetical protein EVJ30_08315 [Exiguobacterium sp. SH5S13]|uniref:cellulose biosynthesis cyclic di-GMP-binding regulatory protein BcsB n=1 Tax=Exiguobacterium sp. SH5S13 TaxID=2510959 RepID=UPI001040718D|nr:hypothetical protein [Exiguobacterium sp. SH5S13]TCI53439.1 hypothetical protein EVJ30_08315 [Exiguobacterium sp. SH5S13]
MKTNLCLALGASVLLTAIPVQASEPLTSTLPIEGKSSTGDQGLTLNDDVLPGESSTRTYTYTILSDETTGSDKLLSLDWAHSNLLIPPSALTVEIDGEPVQSVALSKDTADGNLNIPLRADQLTKGTHEVTVRFTGIVRGRMCDTGNTSGSWLTIRSSSFVSVGNESANLSLSDYPSPFTQTFNDRLTIVLPDQPDTDSLEAGLLLYRQMKGDAADSDNVSIQYERQLKSLDGRYIFVGQADGFTDSVSELIAQLDLAIEDDEVLLERATITDDETSVDALFVLAQDTTAFEGTLDHLLIERQRLQLDGERLVLSSAPNERPQTDVISLQTLGASDLFLRGTQTVSSNYFYPLPVLDDTSSVELDLQFKVSDSVFSSDKAGTAAELIAWVNGVPHTVPLNAEDSEDDWQRHVVTVDASTLKRTTFLDVSFEANGLRTEAPCTDSDLDRWLYISDDSQVRLPASNSQASNEAFLNLASLFSADGGVVVVVPDEIDSMMLTNISNVMGELPATPLTGQIQFVQAGKLDESLLDDRSVLFVGDPEEMPILRDRKADWLVTADERVDLAQYGFVPETSDEFAWIQPSPWNDERAMVVIATTERIDPALIQTLALPSETFNVAVKNQNGAVFTNSDTTQVETAGANTNTVTSSRPVWYFVGFFALIAGIAGLLFVLRRKR